MLFTIKQAEQTDKPLLMNVWEKLTQELHQRDFLPFGQPVLEERSQLLEEVLNNTLNNDKAVIYKALSTDGDLLGTLAVVLNVQVGFALPNSGVIFNLWIHQEHRKKGVGTELVEAAKKWLKKQAATSVQVGWHPGNSAADSFWKKQGFRNYEVIAAAPL
ncbi:MAG: GNAT family N-acetyltransferase [Neptuniibacter sp.]